MLVNLIKSIVHLCKARDKYKTEFNQFGIATIKFSGSDREKLIPSM